MGVGTSGWNVSGRVWYYELQGVSGMNKVILGCVTGDI